MRITFTNPFDAAIRAISVAAEELANAERQVATGRRINVPSDDPAGTVSAIGSHADMLRIDAYSSATDAASSRLAVADSVLSDIVTQLTSAQATALGARGSTVTQAQRTAFSGELLAIRDTLLGDINTQFQGAYLFSGSNVTVAPFAQTVIGISAYQGDQSSTAIDVGPNRTVAGTFDGGQIFQGTDSTHVLDVLTDLASAVSSGDEAAIGNGIDALKRAFDRATIGQAQIGNDLRTLDDGRFHLAADRTVAVSAASRAVDADLVQASARLAQAETAYRAALGAAAALGRVSLMDYLK